jgi:hypothetical protein
MSPIMVRYKVQPDLAETNAELVRAVYEDLDRVRPSHIRYVTFQLDDGVTFVHHYANDSGDAKTRSASYRHSGGSWTGSPIAATNHRLQPTFTRSARYRVFDHKD